MSDEKPSIDELLAICDKMQAASDGFYYQVVFIQNHAFIEFTGLMNEYIKICRDLANRGIDFRLINTHTGQYLPLHDHQAMYLAEKVRCILGPGVKAFAAHLDPTEAVSHLDPQQFGHTLR